MTSLDQSEASIGSHLSALNYSRDLCGTGRISVKGNFTRGTRYSVLGAISTQGIKASHVVTGAYNREQFEFVMNILYYLTLAQLLGVTLAQLLSWITATSTIPMQFCKQYISEEALCCFCRECFKQT